MEKTESKSGEAFHLQKLSNYYSSPISLEKDDRITGLYGWLLLAAVIIAYDAYAIKTKKIETLTRAFWRLTEKPIHGVIPIATWLGLTIHLMAEKNIRKKRFGTRNSK